MIFDNRRPTNEIDKLAPDQNNCQRGFTDRIKFPGLPALKGYTSYISISHTFPKPNRPPTHTHARAHTPFDKPSFKTARIHQTTSPASQIEPPRPGARTFFPTKLRKHPVDAISLNPLSRVTHGIMIQLRTGMKRKVCPRLSYFTPSI